MAAIKRNEHFKQVVVWPGTILPPNQITDFVEWVNADFDGVRIQFLESIVTKPGYCDSDTGGREDVVFAVHEEDVGKFAVPRLTVGMRWIEDVLDNEQRYNEENGIESFSIYPDHFVDYRTW